MKMPIWKYDENTYLRINEKEFPSMVLIHLMNIKMVEVNKWCLTKMNLTSWI